MKWGNWKCFPPFLRKDWSGTNLIPLHLSVQLPTPFIFTFSSTLDKYPENFIPTAYYHLPNLLHHDHLIITINCIFVTGWSSKGSLCQRAACIRQKYHSVPTQRFYQGLLVEKRCRSGHKNWGLHYSEKRGSKKLPGWGPPVYYFKVLYWGTKHEAVYTLGFKDTSLFGLLENLYPLAILIKGRHMYHTQYIWGFCELQFTIGICIANSSHKVMYEYGLKQYELSRVLE